MQYALIRGQMRMKYPMRSSYSPFHLGLLPRRPPHRPCMLDEQLCSFQMKLTLQGVNEKSISVT